MKYKLCIIMLIISGITIGCALAGDEDIQTSDTLRIKKEIRDIVFGKGKESGWKSYFAFSTSSFSYSYDESKINISSYQNLKNSASENKIRLITRIAEFIYKDSQKIEIQGNTADATLDVMIKGEWVDYKHIARLMGELSIGESLRGIAIILERNELTRFIIVFSPASPEVEELIGKGNVCVLEVRYDDSEKINDINYCQIIRNDDINKEINELWGKLVIGVFAPKQDDWNSEFFFMPQTLKENVSLIKDFRIVRLQSEINYVKKSWACEKETLNNLEREYTESEKKDDAVKQRIDKLKDFIDKHRDPNYIKSLEEKLESLKKSQGK